MAISVLLGLLALGAPSAVAAEPGQISGIASDAVTNAPVSGIEVCARETGAGGFESCAVTGGSGEYTIAKLPLGTYTVAFSPGVQFLPQFYSDTLLLSEAQPVVVEAGKTTQEIDASLREESAVSGKVVDASTKAAIKGIDVCLYTTATIEPPEEIAEGCALTNASGEYAIAGLPSGQYYAEFFSPSEGPLNYVTQFYNARASFAEAEPVPVTIGVLTSGIDAELQLGGRISGTVKSARTGAAISEALVCALATKGEIVECAATDAAGEYVMAGLPSGEYEVGFEDAQANYLTQYYNGKPTLATASVLSVGAGSTLSGIDAQLAEGGHIAGRVTSAATGAPLKGIEVCAFFEGREIARCAFTGASGEYAIYGLQGGEYKVGFNGGRAYATQYYDGQPSLAAAQLLKVVPGGTDGGVDAAMRPAGGVGPPPPPPPPPVPLPPPPRPPSQPPPSGSGGVLGSTSSSVGAAAIEALLRHELTPSGKDARIAALLRSGGFRVDFSAPEAGVLVIDWYQLPTGARLSRKARAKPILLASARTAFAAAASKKLRIKLTAAGRALLRHSKTLKLTARAIFTPSGAASVIAAKVFFLRR